VLVVADDDGNAFEHAFFLNFLLANQSPYTAWFLECSSAMYYLDSLSDWIPDSGVPDLDGAYKYAFFVNDRAVVSEAAISAVLANREMFVVEDSF
jgi:hypothetical protein